MSGSGSESEEAMGDVESVATDATDDSDYYTTDNSETEDWVVEQHKNYDAKIDQESIAVNAELKAEEDMGKMLDEKIKNEKNLHKSINKLIQKKKSFGDI